MYLVKNPPVERRDDEGLGPVRTPDPALWADPIRRRLLRLLADRPDGATVAELSAVLGGHVNTARGHLEGLRKPGLVERRRDGSGRAGRPAWIYSLSPIGRSAARRTDEGSPQDEYAQLATAFTEHLAEQPGAREVARSVGLRWGSSLREPDRDPPPAAGASAAEAGPTGDQAGRPAGSRPGGIRRGRGDVQGRLLKTLDRLGFTPEPVAPGGPREEAGGRWLVLRTCPLLTAARRHPEVVCEVHRGLIAGIAKVVRPDDVNLEPWAVDAGCLLQVPG